MRDRGKESMGKRQNTLRKNGVTYVQYARYGDGCFSDIGGDDDHTVTCRTRKRVRERLRVRVR